ncbi:transglutaminase-like domain-containing protein [bacterium]|nr:transglutaminase-like domain-containing protein [bacterium]
MKKVYAGLTKIFIVVFVVLIMICAPLLTACGIHKLEIPESSVYEEPGLSTETSDNRDALTGRESISTVKNEEDTKIIKYVNLFKYSGEYNCNIVFSNRNEIDTLSVYVPTPAEWDSQREINLMTYTENGKVLEDENGNRYISYDKSELKDNKLDLTQSFTFTCYETNTNLSRLEDIPEYNAHSDLYLKYTKNENYLEKDFFKKIAPEIIGNEKNKLKQIRMIYDYVINNLTYRNTDFQGAKFAYQTRGGECGEYSALFVALLRSIGVPARPVSGFWADPKYGKTHVWAEFYVQDIGWIPVDPTLGQQSDQNRQYYFGNLDNCRLIMSKNFNIKLGSNVAGLFQVGAYWWYGSGQDPEFNFSYKMK